MFIILQTLCNAFDKSLRTAYFFFAWDVFFLSVLWYDFLKTQIFPFLYNNLKTLSRLQLRFKIEKFLSRDNLGHPPVLAGKHTVT